MHLLIDEARDEASGRLEAELQWEGEEGRDAEEQHVRPHRRRPARARCRRAQYVERAKDLLDGRGDARSDGRLGAEEAAADGGLLEAVDVLVVRDEREQRPRVQVHRQWQLQHYACQGRRGGRATG